MANNLFRYRNYTPSVAQHLRECRAHKGLTIYLAAFKPAKRTTPVTTREERYRKRHHGMGHMRVRRTA